MRYFSCKKREWCSLHLEAVILDTIYSVLATSKNNLYQITATASLLHMHSKILENHCMVLLAISYLLGKEVGRTGTKLVRNWFVAVAMQIEALQGVNTTELNPSKQVTRL